MSRKQMGFIIMVGVGLLVVSHSARVDSPEQPIQFNHWLHVYNGVDCTVCHEGARDGLRAGLPSLSTCRRCHEDILYESREETKIRTAWEKNAPVAWQPITRLHSHVYFSHRRHVTLGQQLCSDCHGNVEAWVHPPSKAEIAFKGRPGMRSCISCHEKSQSIYAGTDCLNCHH